MFNELVSDDSIFCTQVYTSPSLILMESEKVFFVINSIKLEAHSILNSTIFNSDSAAGSNEINNGTLKS